MSEMKILLKGGGESEGVALKFYFKIPAQYKVLPKSLTPSNNEAKITGGGSESDVYITVKCKNDNVRIYMRDEE